uniref:Uncharacterized protein n=1 Tax=Rheinheimera sp. BAL341 TaxID=1708203 RepID=A0A486XPN3_9GAMM
MRYFYLVVTIVVTVLAIAMLTKDEPSTNSESTVVPLQTIAEVQTPITGKAGQKAVQPDTISLLSQNEQPQTMHELQQQYDDYYALALELLHRARAGDGVSQLNLAELILHCQQMVLIDVDDKISMLLSADISEAEADMLQNIRTESARCANFEAVDYKFFEDRNYENDQVLERTLYWVDKAFKNEVTDAAAYLLGLHLAEVIKLSDDELSLAADMVSKAFAQPTLATMRYLSHLSSSPLFYRVVAALEAEPGFYRSSDMLNFDNSNLGVIQCLEQSVLWTNPTPRHYDCAENVQRYGSWLVPELIPEVEAEVEKVKAAWKKGDYAAAGFEALMPLLNYTHQP